VSGNRLVTLAEACVVVIALAGVGAVALVGGDRGQDVGLGHEPPDPASVYDPVRSGEILPEGYRRGLDRDQILPVYEPVFTSATDVAWPGEMLVIGVAGTDTAKAYPVTHLNSREMVIDWLDGIPILVTW